MELIVDCSLFAKKLQEAFDVDAHCIKYYSTQGCLIFGTTKYQSDVEMPIEKRYRSEDETLHFNALGMAKLLIFLKTLKVQPIVLELTNETIRAKQFVIDFI